MATVNLRVGGNSANMQPRALSRRAANPSTNYIQVNSASVNYASADVLQLFDVPAGSLVTLTPVVETAEGGVATADIGWAEDPNGFNVALDLNVAHSLAAPAAPVTKFFHAEAVISATLGAAIDAAIVGFYITITKI